MELFVALCFGFKGAAARGGSVFLVHTMVSPLGVGRGLGGAVLVSLGDVERKTLVALADVFRILFRVH